MPEEIFKVIDVIVVFQILIFIFIVSGQKKIQFTNKIFLIIFLVSLGICLADRVQYFYRDILDRNNFPHFYNAGDTFLFLYTPSLYFYFRSFATTSFKMKWRYIWHLIPAVTVFLNLLFNYYLQPAEVKFTRLHEGMPFYTKEYQLIIFNVFYIAQTIYFIVMLYLVRNYHKQVKESYSNVFDSQIILLYIIPLVGLLIRITEYSFVILQTDVRMQIDYILVIYAVLIVYLGYRQPKIYLQPVDLGQRPVDKFPDRALKEKLTQLSDTEKFYKDPDISINDLALKLDVNPRRLSTFLNTDLQLSFFNFINMLRIEEAKKMLSDKQSDKTVLEILYEVGFNNKSAFNRVFKEKTGLTPTEYRHHHIQ